MRPEDWARVPWHARQRAQRAARRLARTESVQEQARRIWAGLEPDPQAAEHVAGIDFHPSKPRRDR